MSTALGRGSFSTLGKGGASATTASTPLATAHLDRNAGTMDSEDPAFSANAAEFPPLGGAPTPREQRRRQEVGAAAGAATPQVQTGLNAQARAFEGGGARISREMETPRTAEVEPLQDHTGETTVPLGQHRQGPAGHTPAAGLFSLVAASRVAAHGAFINPEAARLALATGEQTRGQEGRTAATDDRDGAQLGPRSLGFPPGGTQGGGTNLQGAFMRTTAPELQVSAPEVKREFLSRTRGRAVNEEAVEQFYSDAFVGAEEPIQALTDMADSIIHTGARIMYQREMGGAPPNAEARLDAAAEEYAALTQAVKRLREQQREAERGERERLEAAERSERISRESRERERTSGLDGLDTHRPKLAEYPPPDWRVLQQTRYSPDEVALLISYFQAWGAGYLRQDSFRQLDLHKWLTSRTPQGKQDFPPNFFTHSWGLALVAHARQRQPNLSSIDSVIELESVYSFLRSRVDVQAQRDIAYTQFLEQRWTKGEFKDMVPEILAILAAMKLPVTRDGWTYKYVREEGTHTWTVVSIYDSTRVGGAYAEADTNRWMVLVLESIVSHTVAGAELFRQAQNNFRSDTVGNGPDGFSRADFHDVLEWVTQTTSTTVLTPAHPKTKTPLGLPRLLPGLHIADGGGGKGWQTGKGRQGGDAAQQGVLTATKALVPIWPTGASHAMIVFLYIRGTPFAFGTTACHFCGAAGHAPFSTVAGDWVGKAKTDDKTSMFTCPTLVQKLDQNGNRTSATNTWKHSKGGSLLGVTQQGGTPKPRYG